MRYLEDLRLGESVACGTYALGESEIVDFARRYDPQPFHLSHEQARHSIFGRLTASGVHSACAGRRLVLRSAIAGSRFLGSPGAVRLQMHQPVYPDQVVHVSHQFTAIEALAHWPGVAVVTGLMSGVDDRGEPVISLEDLGWYGSRHLAQDFDAHVLRDDPQASMRLGPFKDIAPAQPVPDTSATLYYEQCTPGRRFTHPHHDISASDMRDFRRQFDAKLHDGTVLRNEWYGAAIGLRMMADAFMCRTPNAGGPGISMLRWPSPVQDGDTCQGRFEIIHARPLRSRPHLGLVTTAGQCINQRGELVSSMEVTMFVRRQE